MNRNFIRSVALIAGLLSTQWVLGADQYVVHAPGASIADVARRHGLSLVRKVDSGNVWVIASSDGRGAVQVINELSAELTVQAVEPDGSAGGPTGRLAETSLAGGQSPGGRAAAAAIITGGPQA